MISDDKLDNDIMTQTILYYGVHFRNYRYAAYRQYVWWIYQRLGRKQRKVIPSCVVSAIRKQFPEADGNYTGFKEPSVTELDLAFL